MKDGPQADRSAMTLLNQAQHYRKLAEQMEHPQSRGELIRLADKIEREVAAQAISPDHGGT